MTREAARALAIFLGTVVAFALFGRDDDNPVRPRPVADKKTVAGAALLTT